MKSYITKPTSIRKDQIVNKFYSFLASEHRQVNIQNTHQNTLWSLLIDEDVGSQIDVSNYLNFDSGYFLWTISGMWSLIYESKKWEKISPDIYIDSSKKLQHWDVIISRNASLWKISFFSWVENTILNGWLSRLKFQDGYKYYASAFFIVEYWAEYLKCLTSWWGTQQNAKRQNVLDVPIPFPTTKNNAKPDRVERLISLITQNIIDKEEQIQKKNNQIDELIEIELKDNQKEAKFQYRYPTREEIFDESRLDTGLYEIDFKQVDFLIRNYNWGYFKIPFDKIRTWQTPKDYYYPKERINEVIKLWITPKNLSNNILSNKLWIHTKQINTIKDGDILFGSRGTVWDVFFYDEKTLGKSYVNQSVSSISIDGLLHNKIFALTYFSSFSFKKIISKYIYKGTVPAITPDILSQFLIPKFPESKQREIADVYYNLLEKNSELTLENYLEKERERNKKIGIFQLNMEIFSLREKLEDLIDAVVMEREVEIDCSY